MKIDRRNLIFLGIFTLFFGLLWMTGEPIYTNDTFQHENQMVMREPGYALLLQFCRFLAPQSFYALVVAVQNILAILSDTLFIAWIRKQFRLGMPVSLLFVAILLMPHVMTPLLSSSHLVLTNALMTEGILFSLYPLVFLSLLDAIWAKEPLGPKSIRTLILFLLLSLIRGQMMVLFVVWLLVTSVLAVRKAVRRSGGDLTDGIVKEGLLYLIVLFILAFAARSGIVHVYNYCENGLFVDTASGKAISFANVLYAADREDGAAISDEGLRALFYEIYDRADADRMNYKYAPDTLLGRAAHHEQCHDELNFTYFGDAAKRYVLATQGIGVDRYQELMIAIDEVAARMAKELMPRMIGRYVRNYIAIVSQGFIRTVAYTRPALAWYALSIYIAALALTAFLCRKDPGSRAAQFMAVVLLAIIGNVCAVAFMVQCLSRYMIYNLPLFYMAGILELLELIRLRNGGKDGISGSEV